MWSDNETNRDFLNFLTVAQTAAEVIDQANGNPLSIGVSGRWGVGKSSMISLIKDALRARQNQTFLFVDFNAWLYQGYDDARAALLDVIARNLLERAEKEKSGVDKALDLLRRVDIMRLLKFGGAAAAFAVGMPHLAVLGDAAAAGLRALQGKSEPKALKAAGELASGMKESGEKVAEAAHGVLKDKPAPESPPKEIQELRDHFETTLTAMNVRLVVFVDDLDRCLPATAISTLEAMRLFLFLKGTAFVIAADDKMIRQAVRAHFQHENVGDVTDDLVTNYFDKLIQVPFRVPPLGTQDVRAYMMLLYIDNSTLAAAKKEELRATVCKRLGESWQGKRVDRAFVTSLLPDCPPDLLARLDTADRLAPFMASTPQILGNPRLIKRFLNTLSVRMAIARAQSVTVDEQVLAKMLLWERCAGDEAHATLVAEINNAPDGKAPTLKALEGKALAGEVLEPLPSGLKLEFATAWLAMPPALADLDLRPVVHVSREHLPLLTAADQLTSDAADLFGALAEATAPKPLLIDKIKALARHQGALVMDRLLARARQVQEWTNVRALAGCLTMAHADPDHAARVAAFLSELPVKQLKPALVPALQNEPWARTVFAKWQEATDLPSQVRTAIVRTQRSAGEA